MSTDTTALTHTSLPTSEALKFVSSGKVRDVYAVRNTALSPDEQEGEYLLFVATDRISAYDVVLQNGIPGKGALLTRVSLFWFARLAHIVENHIVDTSLFGAPFSSSDASQKENAVPEFLRREIEPHRAVLDGRTMLVRKAEVVKLEAIVRGYLTGSAWSEYKQKRTVHGIPLPNKYVESSRLDDPLFTPSTKADQGQHDENISPDRARALIGPEVYEEIERISLALYNEAHAYALTRGLVLADTKFEFGLVPSPSSPRGKKIILIDEALTPDSSRYWSATAYAPGGPQASFDKQFLRDWLVKEAGFRKGLESGPEGSEGAGWRMSEEVVRGTRDRYAEAVRMLTGA